jgi:hypothetical protein
MKRRLALLASVAVAASGCGGGSHPPAHASATPKRGGVPAVGGFCGETGGPVEAIRFRTGDGVALAGAVLGSGPVGAVLIHPGSTRTPAPPRLA